MSETLNKRIVTNPEFPVRFSYFKGITGKMEYNKKKKAEERIWSTMVLIPKEDTETIDRFKTLINAVAAEKWGTNIPKNLKVSFRDGDKEGKGGVPEGTEAGAAPYGGNYFVSARSDRQPGVVDADRQPIIDSSMIQSGDYGCISLNCFAYENEHGKGISFGLGNIQFIHKGEPLGGTQVAPDSEFKPIAQAQDEAPTGEKPVGGVFDV
jgi:hypothetical protein